MRARTWIGLLGVVLVLLAISLRSGGPRRTQVGLTSELAGVWKTEDVRYGDRFLEIRPNEVVFGQGDQGKARYRIAGIYLEQMPEGPPVYVLSYRLDGAEPMGELRVRVDHGVLRIASQPKVAWTVHR
jgi:hypothetical protein